MHRLGDLGVDNTTLRQLGLPRVQNLGALGFKSEIQRVLSELGTAMIKNPGQLCGERPGLMGGETDAGYPRREAEQNPEQRQYLKESCHAFS
jgi:hypothetical protein